jgi:hypothetical protein
LPPSPLSPLLFARIMHVNIGCCSHFHIHVWKQHFLNWRNAGRLRVTGCGSGWTAVRNLAPFNLGSRRGYVTGLSTQICTQLKVSTVVNTTPEHQQ